MRAESSSLRSHLRQGVAALIFAVAAFIGGCYLAAVTFAGELAPNLWTVAVVVLAVTLVSGPPLFWGLWRVIDGGDP